MLIPGNRILQFLTIYIIIICPFFGGQSTVSLPPLVPIGPHPEPHLASSLLRSFSDFCFLKLTVISYTKQEKI